MAGDGYLVFSEAICHAMHLAVAICLHGKHVMPTNGTARQHLYIPSISSRHCDARP